MAKPSWLNISPASGSGNGTISNSSGAHTGRLKREGIVTVTGIGVSTPSTYRVIQTPKAEFVSFDGGTELAVQKDGGMLAVSGKSNSAKLTFSRVGASDVALSSSYTVVGQSVANGATIDGDPGATSEYEYSFPLSFSNNNTTDEIVRTLKVTANGGQSAQIAIKQAAGDAFLSVTPTEITIPQDGTAVSVYVTSNTDWTVS